MQILKSVGAVIAGIFTGALLSIGSDFVLETIGIFPPIGKGTLTWWMLLFALVYRGAYTVLSGYVTASFAPSNPVRHAIILGTIGVVVTILGTIANWDASAAWYPIALIIITLPCTWLGGFLKTARR